jgi:hypothetical protein
VNRSLTEKVVSLKQREPLVVTGVLPRGLVGGMPLTTPTTCEIFLEEKCPSCNGSGDIDAETGRWKGPCRECEGYGVVLTDQGRTVLEFVMHHLKSVDSNTLIAKKL